MTSPEENHRPYRERSRSPTKSDVQNPGTNLFITGLVPKIKESELEEIFSKYGVVEKIQIMRDPHSEDSRGFGFINFSNSDEAEAALALNGLEFMGKTLVVQKAKRARARTPTPGQYKGPIRDRRGIIALTDYPPPRSMDRYDRYEPPRPHSYDRRPPPYDRYDRYERDDRDDRRYNRYDPRYDRPPPRGYEREMGGYEPYGRRPPPPYDRERRY